MRIANKPYDDIRSDAPPDGNQSKGNRGDLLWRAVEGVPWVCSVRRMWGISHTIRWPAEVKKYYDYNPAGLRSFGGSRIPERIQDAYRCTFNIWSGLAADSQVIPGCDRSRYGYKCYRILVLPGFHGCNKQTQLIYMNYALTYSINSATGCSGRRLRRITAYQWRDLWGNVWQILCWVDPEKYREKAKAINDYAISQHFEISLCRCSSFRCISRG